MHLSADGGHVLSGGDKFDFIFTAGAGNEFKAGGGNDVVYSGNGGSTVHGGSGNDLVFAGGINNHLFGDQGDNLLAVNAGNTGGGNWLVGGRGFDVLVANRAGEAAIDKGGGDNLIIFKENAGTSFGHASVVGGQGNNTLRFIINNQNPAGEHVLRAEFQDIVKAFTASLSTNHKGEFAIDGLDVSGITGLQLQVDSVDAKIPYLVDHNIVQTVGYVADIPSPVQHLLQQAALWGLLTA